MGGIVVEQDLLDLISKDLATQSCINFILVIGHPFNRIKEDEDFKHRWFIDNSLADKIQSSLKKLYENLKDNELTTEQEMIKTFLGYIENISEQYRSEEIAKRWLNLSKKISKNPLVNIKNYVYCSLGKIKSLYILLVTNCGWKSF